MKKLITLALTGAILMSAQVIAFAGINIEVNGKNVPFDVNNGLGVPFVDENNRTLVPFRIAMEFAGATVDWNNDTRTAIAMKNGIKVEAPIGKNYIYKDGVKETIDTQAVIKDGRTYLPIRAVLEALEYEISWKQETQTVVAETEEYIAEMVVEEEIPVVTEEIVLPKEEVIEGDIMNGSMFDKDITHVRILPESPYKLVAVISSRSSSKYIDAYVGERSNNPGTMLFIIGNKVVHGTGGYYASGDGTFGYFLEEGYDFSDFDKLGFFTNGNKTEITIFDNPLK